MKQDISAAIAAEATGTVESAETAEAVRTAAVGPAVRRSAPDFVTHEFAPVYDGSSRILILGTFPSVKSREQNFYYGHPQNRFWKVIAAITGSAVPVTIEEKKRLLLAHGIAIWDVIASCRIEGSSDSSIRDVTANDIAGLLSKTSIRAVYANGDKAFRLYEKYCRKQAGMEAVKLPSTSPANAAWSLERLAEEWRARIYSWEENHDSFNGNR